MLLPDLEIRAQLSRYLAGTRTLDEFEDWFIPATWSIEREGGSGARLVSEIRSMLFRLSTGEASEADFRALAKRKVNEVVWDLEPAKPKLDAEALTHDL
jgi:hypothetical protein